MLATAQKKIRHCLMLLDNTAQLPFNLIALILKNALDLLENDNHSLLAPSCNLGRRSEHLLELRVTRACSTYPKRDFGLPFFVERYGRCKLPKKLLGGLQHLLRRAAHGLDNGFRG